MNPPPTISMSDRARPARASPARTSGTQTSSRYRRGGDGGGRGAAPRPPPTPAPPPPPTHKHRGADRRHRDGDAPQARGPRREVRGHQGERVVLAVEGERLLALPAAPDRAHRRGVGAHWRRGAG